MAVHGQTKARFLIFSTFRSNHYGYVQPPGNASGINLPRIDPGNTDSKLTDVTVVWFANRRGAGSFIVGWYQNATVYAMCQPAPADARRDYGTGDVGYFVKAKASNCTFLEDDERTFEIPRGEGYPGRSNAFYQDRNPAFAAEVLRYIASGGAIKKKNKPAGGRAHQPSILKRIAIEKAAIETVVAHYVGLGYTVTSVERDNVGWDLTAVNGKRALQIEVKGLSEAAIVAELTPNEYHYFSKNSLDYRLCIVCQALEKPELHVFSFDKEIGFWSTPKGRVLSIEEIISARVSV